MIVGVFVWKWIWKPELKIHPITGKPRIIVSLCAAAGGGAVQSSVVCYSVVQGANTYIRNANGISVILLKNSNLFASNQSLQNF